MLYYIESEKFKSFLREATVREAKWHKRHPSEPTREHATLNYKVFG